MSFLYVELPFVPFNADIILINQFSAIAAISAYEARDYKEQEIHPVFEDDVDYDYIREIELQDDFYAFNLDDEEKESYEDIRIPFDDFLFHTQSLEC
jgi:hypothetical protein